MSAVIYPVCSRKPRPRLQRGAKGHAGWGRDVYHAAKSDLMTTYCGRDSSDWLRMDEMPAAQAVSDGNFCSRCRALITERG